MAKTQPDQMLSSNTNHDPWWNKIKGIGQKRAEWLQDEFNIDSTDEFAALSLNEIDSRVQIANNIRWRRDEIESSITNARKITAEENKLIQQDVAVEKVETVGISNSSIQEDGWEYVAAFNVEFKVQKGKDTKDELKINVLPFEISKDGDWGDAKGEEPTHVQGEDLYQWMFAQLAEETEPEPMEIEKNEPAKQPSVAKEATETPSVRMNITEIQAFQRGMDEILTITSREGKPLLGYLIADKPFDLQVSFDLVGFGAKDIVKKQIPYKVQFFSHDIKFGGEVELGNTELETLVDSQTSYKARLSEVSLSAGMYRLRVFAKLKNIPPISDYLEVPLLQVV